MPLAFAAIPREFTPAAGFGVDGKVPAHATLKFNPVEKWVRFGRFPYKMLLHLILMVVYTSIMLTFGSLDLHHVSHALRRFYSVYLGISGAYGDRAIKLSTAGEFDKAMLRLQRAYFDTAEEDPTDFLTLQPDALTFVCTTDDGGAQSFNLTDVSPQLLQKRFASEGFDFDALGNVRFAVARALVPLKDFPRRATDRKCFIWDLAFVMRSMHTGQVDLSLEYRVSACRGFRAPPLLLSAGFVAAASLLLELRSIRRWWRAMQRSRTDLGLPLVDDTTQGATGMLAEFDFWRLVAISANLIQVTGVVYACCASEANIYVRLNLFSAAAALAWFNLVRYLAFASHSYTLYKTLAIGLPKVTSFMVGVIPLFVAYALVGMGLWGFDTEWFTTFSMSTASLFSLLNGDIVHDSYLNLKDTSWPLAQIYLYTFLSVFIYVVLNIFISIVEESFFLHRRPPPDNEPCSPGRGHSHGGAAPAEATPPATRLPLGCGSASSSGGGGKRAEPCRCRGDGLRCPFGGPAAPAAPAVPVGHPLPPGPPPSLLPLGEPARGAFVVGGGGEARRTGRPPATTAREQLRAVRAQMELLMSAVVDLEARIEEEEVGDSDR